VKRAECELREDRGSGAEDRNQKSAANGHEGRAVPAAGISEYWGCVPRIKVVFGGMAKTSKKAKRTPSAAFMKPVTPDEKLAKVVGDKPLPRTELTKKLWAYIRKNGLQDTKKRTFINADENLKAVFNGKKQVNMFEMTKLVSKHLKK
jgi:chromatin remodeling complex protein RSC6